MSKAWRWYVALWRAASGSSFKWETWVATGKLWIVNFGLAMALGFVLLIIGVVHV